MITAIYIKDGLTQLVLTPESEFEKNTLALLKGKSSKVTFYYGSFYECQGGWVRQSKEDTSLILVVEEGK